MRISGNEYAAQIIAPFICKIIGRVPLEFIVFIRIIIVYRMVQTDIYTSYNAYVHIYSFFDNPCKSFCTPLAKITMPPYMVLNIPPLDTFLNSSFSFF